MSDTSFKPVRTIRTTSPSSTKTLGVRLGEICRPGDIICLNGDLGAGKTTLTQAIAIGAGVDSREYVSSPTFAVLHEYKGKITLYHMDFYRLSDEEEIISMGLDDFFYLSGVTVIEWSDRAGNIMPDTCLRVDMTILAENSRSISFSSQDNEWRRRISQLFDDKVSNTEND